MGYITAVLIIAILTYGFYSFCELLVRRKERLAMIEKMIVNADNFGFKQLPGLPQSIKGSSKIALSIGCLFIGVGVGLVLACLIDISMYDSAAIDNLYERRKVFDILYPALATNFGGIGLMVSYFIERKHLLKDKENKVD